MIDREKSVEMR